MTERPDISIVGAGKVGTALGVLAARAGRRVRAVASRSRTSAEAAAARIEGAAACGLEDAAGAGELVLLTVPDDAIAALAERLAPHVRPGAVVAHCSGALSSEVLAPLRRGSGGIGSMHPLQTFPTVEAALDRLPGAFYAVEGDETAVVALEALVGDLSGRVMAIRPEAKPLYHAGASMACNYLSTLLDAAGRLAEAAGLDRAEYMQAIVPVVLATVQNAATLGPEASLTGPIERGDADTVRRQVAALAGCETDLRELFRVLGRSTVDLARRKGRIGSETAKALAKTLDTLRRRE